MVYFIYYRYEIMKKNKEIKKILLFRKKERKNFKRKFKRILGSKINKNKQSINKNQSKRKQGGNNKKETLDIISIPEILNLDDDNRVELIRFVKRMHKIILRRNNPRNFIIDHKKMKNIEPEALLILASEIKRCTKIKDIPLAYNEDHAPKNKEIKKMLNLIGYWKHFNIPDQYPIPDQTKNKTYYLKITDDNTALFEKYIDIRDFFDNHIRFIDNNIEIQAVYDEAITEAISNAVEHAYIKKQKIDTLNKNWWLCGYYNNETKELSFACYDQGIGLGKTLSYNDNDKIKHILKVNKIAFKKGSKIIKFLIEDELPKYEEEDRGYGFKRFKNLINKYQTGSINIYSNKGHYCYSKIDGIKKELLKDYPIGIRGTLISWKLLLK